MRTALAALLVLSLAPVVAQARDIEGTDPPFHAHVPDAFAPVGGARAGVQVYVATAADGVSLRVITLRPLDGTLAQEALDERALRDMLHTVSPGARVRVARGAALGVEVPIVLGESGGHDALALAQIPSSPRALQLLVTGPSTERDAVERITRDVMTSLRARTNWLTRGEILRRRAARGLVIAGWVCVAAYGLAWAARFRSAPRPGLQRALLLAVGAIFAVTAGLLSSVHRGASAFEPVTPALVALVLVVNAIQTRART
ncbi:MAG: hypothetical protein WCJ30_06120 [Deltaproteobacteria bacterium]